MGITPRVSNSLFSEGGEWSPPLGGDSRGGIRSGRGGNAAWNITTIGLNTTVYLMVIWRQLFSSKTAYNILSVRIFHKLDYCKQLNSPRSGKKFPLGGDKVQGGGGLVGGGLTSQGGGNDLHSTVSPPVPPSIRNPDSYVFYTTKIFSVHTLLLLPGSALGPA